MSVNRKDTADKPDASGYPRRPPYFSHRYTRLLTKSAAAQDIGADACWLLTIVVHQEDAKRYRGPVTFYNEQLMPLCGFGGRDRLTGARSKAVEHGWLHYEEGRKRCPGRYWVLVPAEYVDADDGPMDESTDGSFRPETGRQSVGNRTETPPPSTLALIPESARGKAASRAAVDPQLLVLIRGWNSLPAGVVKPGNNAKADPPAKALVKAWSRATRDTELRELLADVPAILAAIGKARFCHGQGWFSLAWLFGRNKNGELNLPRLIDGAFDDDSGIGRPQGAQESIYTPLLPPE